MYESSNGFLLNSQRLRLAKVGAISSLDGIVTVNAEYAGIPKPDIAPARNLSYASPLPGEDAAYLNRPEGEPCQKCGTKNRAYVAFYEMCVGCVAQIC